MFIERSKLYLALLILSLPLIYLCPVINSPLSSDDLHNFHLRVNSKDYYAQNILTLGHGLIDWAKSTGRYSPFSSYLIEIVFKYFQTISRYKAFLFSLNLCALASFVLLLFTIGRKSLIPFFIVVYGSLVQFRMQFHDPFTSLHGMYPSLAICIFLCTSLYIQFLKRENLFVLMTSLLFFISAYLISEVGLTLIPFLFICSFFISSNPKKIILSLFPFIISGTTYILYVLSIRRSVKQFYEGVQTNFDVSAMFEVLAKQLFSALPLSNLYRQMAIPKIIGLQLSAINILAVVAIITFSVSIILLQKWKSQEKVQFSLPLLGMGLTLLIVPSIFIMSSLKYQHSLCYGFGYLPFYIQNFGTAILLSYLLYALTFSAFRGSKLFFIALLSSICLASSVAFLINNAQNKVRAYEQSLPFEAQIKSLNNGILSSVHDKSTIILAPDYIWKAPKVYQILFKNITGKDFNVYDIEDWEAQKPDTINSGCYVFSCEKGDTIYSRLFSSDCLSGKPLSVLKTDTFFHNVRLSEIEKPLLIRHCE